MIVDARSVESCTGLAATVCVVGAGPAGITVATELAAAGVEVVLLESGARADLTEADALNDADAVGPKYSGLRATRKRGLGGTVRSWNTIVAGRTGAKFVPLDARDLRSAPDGCEGWPIAWSELVPYYRRAQALCGLGAFAYEAADWPDLPGSPLDLAGTALTTRVYQFGPAKPWLDDLPRSLADSERVRLCTGATVCGWIVGSQGRIHEAIVRGTLTRREFRVQAEHFVLACGAAENARLLMVLRGREPSLGLDAGDWLGRCFMEHPRDDGMFERGQSSVEAFAFYDLHALRCGAAVGGRIALDYAQAATRGLPAMSVSLSPRPRALNAAGTLLRRFGLAKPPAGYGWSALRNASHRFDGFNLRINFEQRPLRTNRLLLASAHDALGLPKLQLEWGWPESERRAHAALRTLIATTFERRGLGSVQFCHVDTPDLDAHHHAGTTRMAQDERHGVVDRDGRVFGLDNLHVTGASIFPTAGYANPTLTIVALAVRLARHLRERHMSSRTRPGGCDAESDPVGAG